MDRFSLNIKKNATQLPQHPSDVSTQVRDLKLAVVTKMRVRVDSVHLLSALSQKNDLNKHYAPHLGHGLNFPVCVSIVSVRI